ncbi:MAG: fimbrillin family protein, partial [Prevotella sp.]|nr:fimbrillin family protein [Prevotella sp.]
ERGERIEKRKTMKVNKIHRKQHILPSLLGGAGGGLLMGLMALMILVGCSSDEAAGESGSANQGNPVGFSAEVLGQAPGSTRDAVTYTGYGVHNTENLKDAGFGVYCWYTGSTTFDPDFTVPKTHIKDYAIYELMRNQKVTWDAGTSTWGYSPTKYWPLDPDEKLTFRAYAPYANYLVTDSKGMPMLPVTVRSYDYCTNNQQDPLWGTSNYVAGVHDTENNNKFGTHYNNFTYPMSGDELTADARDGVIDWYFHHGMAMFALQVSLAKITEGTEVRFTGIHCGPYYDKGLLNIYSSPTANETEKPIWQERSGNIYVDLRYNHDDGVHDVHNDVLNVVLTTTYQNVAVNGLLTIPRDYSDPSEDPGMEITVSYTTKEGAAAPVPHTATAYLKENIQGNTVYWLQLALNAEENTLYIADFVDLDWQTGTYEKVDL